MITQSESGLTQAEYDNLRAATGDVAARIRLQRLGPVWSDAGHTDAPANAYLDAILFDGHVVRVYKDENLAAEKLASESASTQDWESVPLDSGIGAGEMASLATDGSTLRLFFRDGSDRIMYSDCTDLSVGFGTPTAITSSITNLKHLAAAAIDTVHYITETDKHNRRFHVGASSAGSWSFGDSDVLYPFPIDSMDAVKMANGTDVIALAASLPPLLGEKAEGTGISTEAEDVQAILIFLYASGRYSDHYVFDVTDRIVTNPGRANVRLSLYNGIIFLTYTRHGGSDDAAYRKCAISRSVTGKFFEFPELVDIDAPAVVVPRSDYLYLVGEETRRSPRCVWAGQSPDEQDITDYTTRTESQAADIRQTVYTIADVPMDDGSHELDGTLISSSHTQRMRAVYDLGYWVGSASSAVQVGVEDVVSVVDSTRLPAHNLTLTASDVLSRLNRITSDHAAEFPGLEIGRDPLDDPTDTGWGGMRHLASYKPSWKAYDGVLRLASNNKEGLCVSTFVVNALNGSIQSGLSLIYPDRDEYAGLAFRVYDKNTLYYLAFHPDEQQVQLYQRKATGYSDQYSETLVDYVDASGWNWLASEELYHYLKVWVRYGRAYLYRSDDGVTWYEVSWNSNSETYTELPGQPDGTTTYEQWSGKFGLIGRGYSNEDSVDWGPPAPPEPPKAYGVVILSKDQILVSFDAFDTSNPHWYNADPDDDIRKYNGIPIQYNGNYIVEFLSVAAIGTHVYVTTRVTTWNEDTDDFHMYGCGLWHCPDISKVASGTQEWELLISNYDAKGDTDYYWDYNYAPCIGALYASETHVCAAVHTAFGNNPPSGYGTSLQFHNGSGVYIFTPNDDVQASTGTYMHGFGMYRQITPVTETYALFLNQPSDSNLHAVYGEGSSFSVNVRTVKSDLAHECAALQPGDDSWTRVWFGGECYVLHAVSDNGFLLGVKGSQRRIYRDFRYDSGFILCAETSNNGGPETSLGIDKSDDGWLFMGHNGNHDLYLSGCHSDYDRIGEAEMEFGLSTYGSHAIWARGLGSGHILWIVGSAVGSPKSVLVYSDDSGASWSDLTGDMFDYGALGASNQWHGWTAAATGNSMVRLIWWYDT